MRIDEGPEKLSVVPEVFYDLISRVPAGMIIIVAAYISLPECQLPYALRSVGNSPLVAVVIPIVGLVMSYVIGLALSSLSGLFPFPQLDWVYWASIRKGFLELSKYPGAKDVYDADSLSRRSRLKARMKLHIFLKRSDARVGLEMAKHQAEASLFTNLTVGLPLLLLFFLYSDSQAREIPGCVGINPQAYAVVAVLCGLSAVIAFLRNQGYWRYHFGFAESFLKNKSEHE